MRAINILTGLGCVVWAYLLWSGIDGIEGVAAQHAPGYPSSGQIRFYIGVPGALLATLLVAAIVFDFVWRSPTLLAIFTVAATLLPLPYYLLMYGGGV